ncbi:MAG: hypothetical protein LC116_00990 [Bacteroidetes bacterium]|nr:hypothetical protein [Bacteroidota bacterium]MCZ2131762.1 hypothetical protein [Bacteroidota bacterium]
MKILRSFTVALLFGAMLVCLVPFAKANINVVSSGPCENGRTWWMNIELDDNGAAGCVIGMGCDGVPYRKNCGAGALIDSNTTNVSAYSSGNDVFVTVSADSHIKVFDIVSGNVVYEYPGIVMAGINTNINAGSWGSGLFIIVAFNPMSEAVTGHTIISF